jgi:GNAT superfamily N-acetyltransferase
MTTAAAHKPIQLPQASAMAAHIRDFVARTCGVDTASNPGSHQPHFELKSRPIAPWPTKTGTVADPEAERQCRVLCRPIRTGFGQVAVRPMTPSDAGMAQAFVTGLSGASRYFRFFQALRCLSPAMLDHFTRVNHVSHVALAGVVNVEGQQMMVAEARYAVSADGTSAEIALTVADQWQRHGLASELIETLERIAVAAGITRLTGECLAVNEGFAGLARSLGFRVFTDASDRSLLRVEKIIGQDTGMLRSAIGSDAVRIPAVNC